MTSSDWIEVSPGLRARVGGKPATVCGWRPESAAELPVLLGRELCELTDLAAWTRAGLENVAGNCEVPVCVSATGSFPGADVPPSGELASYRSVSMTLREALRRMHGEDSSWLIGPGERYYLNQLPLELEVGRTLAQHVRAPSWLPSGSGNYYWIGMAGNVTPIHWDSTEGILAQLIGTKTVLLWPPEQRQYLYLNAEGSSRGRQSWIGSKARSIDAFPLFSKAEALVCTIRPGDALYIPAGWLHWVRTNEFSVSVSWCYLPLAVGREVSRVTVELTAAIEHELEALVGSIVQVMRREVPEPRSSLLIQAMHDTGVLRRLVLERSISGLRSSTTAPPDASRTPSQIAAPTNAAVEGAPRSMM